MLIWGWNETVLTTKINVYLCMIRMDGERNIYNHKIVTCELARCSYTKKNYV